MGDPGSIPRDLLVRMTSAGDEGEDRRLPDGLQAPDTERVQTYDPLGSWGLGIWSEMLTSRDAGLLPSSRLPRSLPTLAWANDQRTFHDGHSRSDRAALTVPAVRPRGHSYHSQADNAG